MAPGGPAKFREALPQLGDDALLTDGGLETVLIFHQGVELPEFAAFDLLRDDEGTARIREYYEPYLALAAERGLGFVLESPTWRANLPWAEKIGYYAAELRELNLKAVAILEELREAHPEVSPIVISGCIGPSDDGYDPGEHLSAEDARKIHSLQTDVFAEAGCDLTTAITMTYVEEATGIVLAARDSGIPVAISFTAETDGRLPSGAHVDEAIAEVDDATDGYAAYFMLNCAHPTHLEGALARPGSWTERVRGLRANASTMSHEELDAMTELDDGDPEDLGRRYAELRNSLPALTVFGGCCGTDHRHVRAIRDAIA